MDVESRKVRHMRFLTLMIFIYLLSNRASASGEEFIVWNVGQGLWTTIRTATACIHSDMGGETAPWRAIESSCRDHSNSVSFSHWDLDHIGFAARAARVLKSLCLRTPPAGLGSQHKQELLSRLRFCASSPTEVAFRQIEGARNEAHLSSNDVSHVFLAGQEKAALILLPGDSTARAEKNWAPRLAKIPAWVLVLGHHGSRTSTSPDLVANLPFARMAVASSRKAKYGHPHREVIERLRSAGIALLRTEDWGSLHFEIPARAPQARSAAGDQNASRITDDKVCTRDSNCGRPVHKSRGHRTRSSP